MKLHFETDKEELLLFLGSGSVPILKIFNCSSSRTDSFRLGSNHW